MICWRRKERGSGDNAQASHWGPGGMLVLSTEGNPGCSVLSVIVDRGHRVGEDGSTSEGGHAVQTELRTAP